MPGTIQVSVLDFVDLQSSSEPSQISVKVSMGKKEYQTLDKGDFSFPLTTFRDNLVVTLHDAEGNKISHAGVEIRKVVEKGVLDEMFPLEGGGHVHMKLQFLLSDQDRQRIRTMRELAMKKKHKDLLNSELRRPERVIAVDSKVAPSVQLKHEMSDSHKRPLQNEMVANEGNPNPRSNVFKKGKSSPEGDEGSQSIQKKQTSPADTNILRAAFVPSKEVGQMSSVETAASSADVSLGTTHLKESSHLESSGSVAARDGKIPVTSKQIGANDQNKQSPLKKSSSVRNMISAFESSQNQDMTPKIRSPSTKSELIKAELKVPPKNSELNEVEMEKNRAAESESESGVRNPVNSADLLQNCECIRQEEQIGSVGELAEAASSQDMRQFEELRAKHLQTSTEDLAKLSTIELSGLALPQEMRQFEELKAKHLQSSSGDTVRSSTGELYGDTVRQNMEKSFSGELSRAVLPQDMRQFEELRAKDTQTSSENLVRSTGERASVSGRKPYNQLSRTSFSGKQHPDKNLGAKNGGKGTKLQKSQRDYTGEFPRNQHQSSEIYGSWLFPGEGKRLCFNTAGNEMVNLMGGCLSGDESEPGKTSSSTSDNVTQFEVVGGTATDVEVGNSSQRLRNSELEDSAAGAENSAGPLGQVMRVVIMVGFAALVFLTRQRKPR